MQETVRSAAPRDRPLPRAPTESTEEPVWLPTCDFMAREPSIGPKGSRTVMSILPLCCPPIFEDPSKPQQGRKEICCPSAPAVLGDARRIAICSVMRTWPFGVHQMSDDHDVRSWDRTAAAQAAVGGCHETHADAAAADFRQVS